MRPGSHLHKGLFVCGHSDNHCFSEQPACESRGGGGARPPRPRGLDPTSVTAPGVRGPAPPLATVGGFRASLTFGFFLCEADIEAVSSPDLGSAAGGPGSSWRAVLALARSLRLLSFSSLPVSEQACTCLECARASPLRSGGQCID